MSRLFQACAVEMNATELVLPGLDGDAHGRYELAWYFQFPESLNIEIRPNGVATNLSAAFSAAQAAPAQVTNWLVNTHTGSAGDVLSGYGKAILNCTREVSSQSVFRTLVSFGCSSRHVAGVDGQRETHGLYLDNTDNLESLVFVADTTFDVGYAFVRQLGETE